MMNKNLTNKVFFFLCGVTLLIVIVFPNYSFGGSACKSCFNCEKGPDVCSGCLHYICNNGCGSYPTCRCWKACLDQGVERNWKQCRGVSCRTDDQTGCLQTGCNCATYYPSCGQSRPCINGRVCINTGCKGNGCSCPTYQCNQTPQCGGNPKKCAGDCCFSTNVGSCKWCPNGGSIPTTCKKNDCKAPGGRCCQHGSGWSPTGTGSGNCNTWCNNGGAFPNPCNNTLSCHQHANYACCSNSGCGCCTDCYVANIWDQCLVYVGQCWTGVLPPTCWRVCCSDSGNGPAPNHCSLHGLTGCY